MRNVLVLSVVSLFAMNTFASGSYSCEVFEKVVFSYDCVICESRNADNDCVKEVETQCLSTQLRSTNVKDQKAISNKSEIFLGQKGNDISFIFNVGKSGFSARLSSIKEDVETTQSSTVKIDVSADAFELSAKTKQNESVVGNITELLLSCRP